MTSIDHTRAKADASTVFWPSRRGLGPDFLKRSRDFVDVVQKSQVTTRKGRSARPAEKVNPDGSVGCGRLDVEGDPTPPGLGRGPLVATSGHDGRRKPGPKMAKVEFVP